MSGRPDSDLPPDTQTAEEPPEADDEAVHDDDSLDAHARRARWAAVGTGVVLALAGTAAALLRASGTAPVLVPAAYACGASVCALAAVLGARGRTRRALWAAVAGVMIMALGDQFD
ncbi:hypothetical protein G3I18_20905 [Actinospica acidiphila]|uniref:Uncharacterized protein n=1 Tax=Actinospica acidiphila TaxID=304899 RepID=A0A9X5CPT7_9ACTN|nr:hypothetical protein [Actinospica acidiphila]NEC51001.1 hypothetical protein [Actinospica acidiphila]